MDWELSYSFPVPRESLETWRYYHLTSFVIFLISIGTGTCTYMSSRDTCDTPMHQGWIFFQMPQSKTTPKKARGCCPTTTPIQNAGVISKGSKWAQISQGPELVPWCNSRKGECIFLIPTVVIWVHSTLKKEENISGENESGSTTLSKAVIYRTV